MSKGRPQGYTCLWVCNFGKWLHRPQAGSGPVKWSDNYLLRSLYALNSWCLWHWIVDVCVSPGRVSGSRQGLHNLLPPFPAPFPTCASWALRPHHSEELLSWEGTKWPPKGVVFSRGSGAVSSRELVSYQWPLCLAGNGIMGGGGESAIRKQRGFLQLKLVIKNASTECFFFVEIHLFSV